jgi:hypothetical protein
MLGSDIRERDFAAIRAAEAERIIMCRGLGFCYLSLARRFTGLFGDFGGMSTAAVAGRASGQKCTIHGRE